MIGFLDGFFGKARWLLLIPFGLLGTAIALADQDPLKAGFSDMYNLEFASAHTKFEMWEKQHPDRPEGPVFDAAAYLFSEFDRLKILQSEFFVDDGKYTKLKKQTPDQKVKQSFERSIERGMKLAEERLKQMPTDEGAMLARVMALGLKADYLALIQKQNFAALGIIKQATLFADELIKAHPSCYDAFIAGGIENYLLSLKPAPVRWLLHATGAQTDKQTGIQKLKVTAEKGDYLQPYAQLLLAVAALRDKNNTEAKRLLSDLASRFPKNELYQEELKAIR